MAVGRDLIDEVNEIIEEKSETLRASHLVPAEVLRFRLFDLSLRLLTANAKSLQMMGKDYEIEKMIDHSAIEVKNQVEVAASKK